MKKNIMKNRVFIGSICIVAAFVISFIFNTNSEEKTDVILLQKDLNSGEKITEDDITKLTLSKYNLPTNLITSEDDVIGKYIKTKSIKDDFLTTNKISNEPISSSAYFSNLGNKQAISISLKTTAKGLSGNIESGDIVSIIVPKLKEDGQDNEEEFNDDINVSYVPQELKYVEVIGVTDDNGSSTDDKTKDEDKQMASTITLFVNEAQAILLAELEQNENVHLSLIVRGNDEYKNKLLKEQDKILGIDIEKSTEESTEESTEKNKLGVKND